MIGKARARWSWKAFAATTATVSTAASLAPARTLSRCPSAASGLSTMTNVVTMTSSSLWPLLTIASKHRYCRRPATWAATSNHRF